MTWTEYERQAWDLIQQRKQHWFDEFAQESWSRRAGEAISDRTQRAAGLAKRISGVGRAAVALNQGSVRFQQMVTNTSGRTVRTSAVLRMYSRHGIDAGTVRGLRGFTLDQIDPVVHTRRLDLR